MDKYDPEERHQQCDPISGNISDEDEVVMGQSQELSQKKPDVVSDSENLIKQARAHCRDYLTKREEIYVEEVGNVSKELTSPPALPKM